MFRNIAAALVAASVIAAPVLAQEPVSGAGKGAPAVPAPAATVKDSKIAPAPATTVKTVKADKAVTKHRKVAHHHRYGTKMVKHVNHGKYTHHTKHGGTTAKQVSNKPDPLNQVSTKPATKSGVN